MKNLGIKQDVTEMPTLSYPTLYINSKQLPEVEDYDVGEEIEMKIICKVTRKNETQEGKEKRTSVNMDIKKCEILNLKDERKKAKDKGIDYKKYREIRKRHNLDEEEEE